MKNRTLQSMPSPARSLAVMVLAALSLLASPAGAQMGNEMVPDEMSTVEFQRYLDRLGVLDVQRQAARAFHDQYKADFRQFQETDIAAFKKSMIGMTARLPKRDQIERLMQERQRLTNRVRAMDDGLFAQLQPLLTEEQIAKLPRARMARERARAKTQMMNPFGGGAGIDLSEMLVQLELADSQRQAIDPILAGYEQRLTRQVNELNDAAMGMMLNLVNALEEAGFSNEDDFMQPETQQKMMEVMREAWGAAYRNVGEKGADISALNRQSLTSLNAVLPKDAARTLHRRYFSRAYPMWHQNVSTHERGFERAGDIEGLTEVQRAEIEAALGAYYASASSIVNDIANDVDEFSKEFSPFSFRQGGREEFQEKLGAKQEKLSELASATQQRLERIAGAELWQKAMTARAEDDPNERPEGMAAWTRTEEAAQDGEEVDPEDAHDQYGAAALVPPRISRASLNAYARRLAIGEDAMNVLLQLHDEYREKFKAIRDKEIKLVHDAQSALWSAEDQSGQTPEQIVEKLHAGITIARKAVEDLDDWFFSEIELMLAGDAQKEALQRVRLVRARERYGSRGTMGMSMGQFGGNEHEIDLAALVQGKELTDEQWKSMDAVLNAYETAMTDAARERFDAVVLAERAMQVMNARQARSRGESESSISLAVEWQKVWRDNSRRLQTTAEKISAINRETLPKVLAILPNRASREVRKAYDTKAFPQIYNDPRSAEVKLDAALNLPELSNEQRAQLEGIAKDYRTTYYDLCEKMKASNPGQPAFMGGDREEMQDWSKKMDHVRTLRRERDELNANAILNLKAVLTADQQQQLGGIELPAQRRRDWWDY